MKFLLSMSLITSVFIYADDHDKPVYEPNVAEYYVSVFKDGKDMDDVMDVLEEWKEFLESGLLVRKGNRFFLSVPKGMELSNQILISMFKWWEEIN